MCGPGTRIIAGHTAISRSDELRSAFTAMPPMAPARSAAAKTCPIGPTCTRPSRRRTRPPSAPLAATRTTAVASCAPKITDRAADPVAHARTNSQSGDGPALAARSSSDESSTRLAVLLPTRSITRIAMVTVRIAIPTGGAVVTSGSRPRSSTVTDDQVGTTENPVPRPRSSRSTASMVTDVDSPFACNSATARATSS